MKGFGKVTAGVFLAATLTTSLAVARPAQASSEGRKNTAIAVGAVAIHQLLKGKTTNAVIAGAGAAAAYKRYKDAKKSEDRTGRRRASQNRDWFDKLTGKGKNEKVTYRRDQDRVSRRDTDRYRDRYEDRYEDRYNDRYEDDDYNDRYDD
ncbi:MAG: hypothetical protein KY468_10805 [Armatimonadetes bacterium]|nr:hypothetical protein [Armatimonadota bacterium]